MSTAETPSVPKTPDVFLGREQLLALSESRRYEDIELPGLGKVRVRSLLASEEILCANYPYDDNGKIVEERRELVLANRLIHCLVDQQNVPLFTDEHVVAISKWPEPIMEKVRITAWKLNHESSIPRWAKN